MSKKVKGVELKCNICGNKYYSNEDFYDSIQAKDEDGNLTWIYEFNLDSQGYGSFIDNAEAQFHICDDCMKELFEEMKIKPIISDSLGKRKYGNKSKLEIEYEEY